MNSVISFFLVTLLLLRGDPEFPSIVKGTLAWTPLGLPVPMVPALWFFPFPNPKKPPGGFLAPVFTVRTFWEETDSVGPWTKNSPVAVFACPWPGLWPIIAFELGLFEDFAWVTI